MRVTALKPIKLSEICHYAHLQDLSQILQAINLTLLQSIPLAIITSADSFTSQPCLGPLPQTPCHMSLSDTVPVKNDRIVASLSPIYVKIPLAHLIHKNSWERKKKKVERLRTLTVKPRQRGECGNSGHVF